MELHVEAKRNKNKEIVSYHIIGDDVDAFARYPLYSEVSNYYLTGKGSVKYGLEIRAAVDSFIIMNKG
ncbi:hypothetical protein P4571_07955 [Niallia alba]|uniref:hypothetical protein n=1 Tax=Niallia alba TaxID=2729105 RepID=UPI002E225E87|nr:hypothetical protein [Niallia alba]